MQVQRLAQFQINQSIDQVYLSSSFLVLVSWSYSSKLKALAASKKPGKLKRDASKAFVVSRMRVNK